MARVGDQLDKRRHVTNRPFASNKCGASGCRIWRFTDKRNHLIDIGDGDGETHQNMGAVARLAQQKLGAAADNDFAEIRKSLHQILQIQLFRTPAIQGDDVTAE